MSDPYLLHMFNPTKNVSPFDVNMAYEADFDEVIPYTGVALSDIRTLTQDAVFSRRPRAMGRTGIFIGGRDFGLAMAMLDEARAAMVPPFAVSAFADPSGAVTTAAALMASVESWVLRRGGGGLAGKAVYIIGTGPVAVCAGVLGARVGARVVLTDFRGLAVSGAVVAEYNARYGLAMQAGDSGSRDRIDAFVPEADVLIGAAKAGVRVLHADQLEKAAGLLVAADVNAVPPSGIEGVGSHDFGKPLAGTPRQAVGIGALAIGDVKYKTHHALFQTMIESETPVYIDHTLAFEVARRFASA
jgi:methylene-tetrahydromethanopterin dehydrogenase